MKAVKRTMSINLIFRRLLKKDQSVIASDPFAILRAGSGSEAISLF